MKTRISISLFILMAVGFSVSANEPIPTITKQQPLDETLRVIRARTGADFVLAPELAKDMVSGLRETSPLDVEQLLAGYNYGMVWGDDGRISQIFVSGRNDSGEGTERSGAVAGDDLLVYDPQPFTMPARYLNLNGGSVAAVTIPAGRLMTMKKGEKLMLNLPAGQYIVVHDNSFEHDNGDVTWVGYLEGAGKGYRVIITTGEEGSLGQIVTPDGAYSLDLEEGRNWLVDIGNSGLQAGSLAGDEMDGSNLSLEQSAYAEAQNDKSRIAEAKKAKRTKNIKLRSGAVTKSAEGVSSMEVTIDVLVVYTRGMNAKKVQKRLNFLVATANQAYLDSGIPLQLRMAASVAADYPDKNQNDVALNDLTNGNGAFRGIANLRRRYGADLVTLIRPFSYKAQKSCGSAWVNGARGSELYAELGYSVVSDGRDSSGWYCSDYTFAHELGHNMGSVHDAANSSFEGKYPFSHGYGTDGKFGTIMSYINPVVGVFSNPRLTCKTLPCGDAESADNSRSIGLTAPVVAGFMAATR